MLVKKQLKYFDVPLEHAWKVPVLQELLNTRMNNAHTPPSYPNCVSNLNAYYFGSNYPNKTQICVSLDFKLV